MTENTTRLVYLIKLIEVVETLGYSSRNILRSARLSRIDLDDHMGTLPIPDYVAAIQSALLHCPIPDLGFQVGMRTELLEHGVLGYALLSAATLRDSLTRYVRYQFLQGPLLSIDFNADANEANLTARPILHRIGERDTVLRYIIQEWLIGWNQWSSLLGVRGHFFENISLGTFDEQHLDIYANRLGCPVSIGGDATVASFPAELLDRPLNYADQTFAALCDEQCRHILEELDLGHGLAAEIHRLLAATPGSIPRMESIAKRLFVDVRTLRRRLLREGTTFQGIVKEFRMSMAKRYLRETTLPANEIAILVGYADAANFYREFRRVLKITPQGFRSSLTA
jgi:AraC-like DNA-binding protein